MKKFIRSKIDLTENSNQSPPHECEQSPSDSPEQHTTKEEQEALLEKAKSVQPPPPSASSPAEEIDLRLPQKQEIDVSEYANNNTVPVDHAPQCNLVQTVPKPTICRDFIRGTCKRGAFCRYAHQCDLSQLPGVYKFCRDFQNAVCVLPHCRYVHATVFEEQNFYRTGQLPAHAFGHHKKPILLPPPPPPPETEPPPPVYTKLRPVAVLNPRCVNKSPPKPAETPHKQIIKCVPTAILEARPAENNFTKPPPQEHVFAKPQGIPRRAKSSPVRVEPHEQVIKCVPAANLEARPAENGFITSDPPRDRDIVDIPEKCVNCDTMEFRLQFNKDKTENMKKATDDLRNKVDILTRKTNTLYSVLRSLMKTQAAKLRPDGLSRLSALLNIVSSNDKDTGERNLTVIRKA